MYLNQLFQPNTFFSQQEADILSKQRIIQKNLVHFKGFPNRLFKKELLCSYAYFGQYGTITKIILSNKVDKETCRISNNAYITFSNSTQAAYAVLSVDSIKIDNMLVRAFFGTTKYCNHFLKNLKCFNNVHCMFLHCLADKNDIIDEKAKFGYSEHFKLAKEIIGFGSVNSQLFVLNNAIKQDTILPNILTIYEKKHVIMKTKNHNKFWKNEESNSFVDTNSNEANNSTSSSSRDSFLENDINCGICFKLFTSKEVSRFNFVNRNMKINDVPKSIQNSINELTARLAFFIQFNKIIPIKYLQNHYLYNLYIKSKDEEILKLIEGIFLEKNFVFPL